MTASALRVLLTVLVLAGSLAACGGGDTALPPTDDPSDPGDAQPPPADEPDGAALYAEAGCGNCHGESGGDGVAVSIACYPADGLATYVRREGSPHMGGLLLDWTDAELALVAEFLSPDTCASHVPASHDVSLGGVMHRVGLGDADANCTPCHGTSLEGYGSVPSCATCHGSGGSLTCTSCHASAKDNGDGVPVDGRRAVTGEFSLASHHGTGSMTSADCVVCHDMSAHKQGEVRLVDADDPSTVVALSGDPFASVEQASLLEPFCLSCHDDDGADGSLPFSNGVVPPPIDAAAWSSSSHHLAERTCLGDGETFGCHGTAHGSSKRKLLAPAGGSASGVTGDATREEEGFCYTCHQDGGEATTDVETEFGLLTHHVIGSHEQAATSELECTSCHDPHVAGPSSLVQDPDDGGAWAGTLQGFCLTCHDGDPPDGISFPATSSGTGFDKSAFAGTTHATELGGDSCFDCHQPHGSAYAALLRGAYTVADSHERSSGDYDACWDCHSSSTILFGDDAFDEYHEKHVIDEDLTCAECHDVHKGYDSTEPGLIDFSYALNHDWWITLPGSQSLTSSFQFNATTGVGKCMIVCHQESHMNDRYGDD